MCQTKNISPKKENVFVQNIIELQKLVINKVSHYADTSKSRAETIIKKVDRLLDGKRTLLLLNKEEYEFYKNNIKINYCSKEYTNFFENLANGMISKCKLGVDACSEFLVEEFEENKIYNLSFKFDFFSVYIGFDGWLDAVNCNFDIDNKIPLQNKKKKDFKTNKIHSDTFNEQNNTKELREFLKHIIANKDLTSIYGNVNLQEVESYLKVSNEWLTYTIYNSNLKGKLGNILNQSEKQYLKQINECIISNEDSCAIELFNKIIDEKNLSLSTSLELEHFFRFKDDNEEKDLKTNWYNKVLLVNALSISHLSYNCEKKIEFLLEIILMKEDKVWEKALLGIALEFYMIGSIKNDRLFSRFEIIKNNVQLELDYTRLSIVYILGGENNFFQDLTLIEETQKQSCNLFFIKQHELFVPLHRNHLFFDKMPKTNNKNKFIDLMIWSPYDSFISKSFVISRVIAKKEYNKIINAGISLYGMYKDSMETFEKVNLFKNKFVGDSILADSINFFLGIQYINKKQLEQKDSLFSKTYSKINKHSQLQFKKVFFRNKNSNFEWFDISPMKSRFHQL